MSKSSKDIQQQSRLILEELEERRLFSGGIEGLIDSSLDSDANAIYRDLDNGDTAAGTNGDTAAAEQQSQEVVFVDAGVDNYQQLVDDILGNADADRNIEVVVLDQDKDGIEEISEFLAGRDDLDAVHIISHGDDGSIQLGNTDLNEATLEHNNLKIALWANSFAETGDILIYGCNLAETEAGQSLIEDISALTLADVAASTDLTGAADEGGDWALEFTVGQVESKIAVSAELQQEYQGTFATYTVTSLADSGAGSLREAITLANTSGGADTIEFGVAGTISLSSALPTIDEQLAIDGSTAPGYSGDPVVEIDGTGVSGNGLHFTSGADNSTVNALMITNFTGNGIQIDNGADGITITGNWIGTTGTGTTGDGNSNNGINVQGANTVIGGTGTNDGNVITNNGNEGINLTGTGATGTLIQGNIIGLDPDGSTGTGNNDVGIAVLSGAHNTTIGGTDPNAGNIISMNFEGIEISSNNNTVQGNYIGTDITGTLDRGNDSDDGIEIKNNATGNLIGGTEEGAGNLIAYNLLDGVNIVSGSGNTVLGNDIHSNGDQDIDLGAGVNNDQAAPLLANAQTSGSELTVSGSLSSTANSYFRIEFFGADQTYLGFVNVATDGSGNATFDTTLSVSVASGTLIMSTATKSDATYTSFTDTSAFSSTVVSGNAGTAIWRDASTTPQTSDWDGTSFGSTTATAPAGDYRIMQGAEAPTRDEIIIIGVDESMNINGEIWDGSSWSVLPGGTLGSPLGTVSQNYWWSMDVAYEQQSGDAVMVWADGTELKSSVWDGSNWSVPVVVNDFGGSTPRQVQLAAQPNGDEMVMVVSDSNGDDTAWVWDGSSWTSQRSLDTSGGNLTSVYVSYEQQSGDALVTYAKSGDANVYYQIWDGTSWSAEASVAPPGGVTSSANWVTLGSDPGSDRIVMGVVTSGGTAADIWLSVWNGTSWETSVEAETTATGSVYPNVAVAFESTSGQALAAYGEDGSNTVKYRTWDSGSGWSTEQIGPDIGGEPNSLILAADPISDQIMLSAQDANSHVNYVLWDGSGWGTPTELGTSTTEVKNQPFLFLWDQDAVNQAPVNTVPAAQATPQDTALVFSSGSGNALTVSDADAGANELEITLAVTNGSLTLDWPDGGTASATGGETAANTTTAGSQVYDNDSAQTVAVADDGSYVVVWSGNGLGDADGVFFQRFDASGAAVGNETPVNLVTTGAQTAPAVGMDGDGNFVVTWQSDDGDGQGIFARRFDASGSALSGEITVNNDPAEEQVEPSIAVAPDGSFVVAWSDEETTGTKHDVFARIFDSSGTAQGSQFQVNGYTSQNQYHVAVAIDDAGNFVVAWGGVSATDNDGITARGFDASGAETIAEFQVNSTTTSAQFRPSVGMDAAGNFVVTWMGFEQPDPAPSIIARGFDANGTETIAEFLVTETTVNSQQQPAVAMDADGDFVIVWTADGQDGDAVGAWNVYARQFEGDGTAKTGETLVNTTTTSGNQAGASVGMNDHGDFVVSWTGSGTGDADGVFTQSYAVPTGLTFSGGDGVGDTSMTFTGSIADINNALEGLVFTPDNGFSGTATLTITTNDQGNTGSGGALQDVDTVDITVGSATNTAPTLVNNAGLTAAEGSTTVITNTQLGYTDAQQPASSIVYTVTTSPANGQLELTTNPDVAITSFTQAQIDAGEVVYVHDGSETAADSFGFTVDDGQGNYASGPSVVGIGTLTNVTNGISNARAPDYSPDGSKVVFSRNNDIYIMNADGSNQTPLVTAAGGDFQAVWSPDGSKIAFTSNRDGNDEIYVIDVDGTNETRITSHVAKDSAPAWSPDSSKIAFTSDRDGDKEIWVMDADGSNLVQLTDNTAITDGGASWSPDGSKIVFQSTRDGGDYEIYVMNADGSGQTRLTSEAGIDVLGDWSPDGSKLLFYSERDGNREIYVMDADGSNQVRLTNDAGEDIEAEWSPDGTSILFVSDRDGDYDIYSASVIYENTFAITVTPVNDAPTFIEGAFGNWSFDEGSGDSVGESAIGISGGTLGSTAGADANDPTWTTGVFGQALHFDGVDDYVEIADAPGIDISGPEFSASLWMNPDSGPNTEDMLFMKGDRTGDVNYYLSWKDTNVFTWAFRESGVWHYQDMPVTTMPTTGEWNHIGITFDRPTVTLYVNGDKYVFDNVATGGSMDNDLTANDDVLWIGAGRSGGSLVGVNQFSGPFAGSIDELALFDRALTDADMEVIRASAPPVVTASAFSLDENSANNTVVGTVAAYDPDVGDTLSYAITAGNTGGAFAIDANGQITVANSAALDFETNPVFTLTVEATDDGSPNLSDSTTVTITLNNVNDAPVATDDSATTDENTPVAIDLLANDSDAETDPLTATIVSGPANGTLVFTPTDVVNETNLTNGSWNDRQAAWSPDGSQILFRSDRDGNHEIYVMDADGSNLIRLTNDAGTDGTPAWSPDGTQIVFGSNRDGDYEIYVMDADGSNVVQLTNNAAADVGAQWSPDGTQIVFVSNRDGNNEIYVMNADGSGQTRLTTAAGNDEDPVWSPDGTQIVFKSERDGNAEIYVMNADGSTQTRLTTDAAIDSKPNWSPDGSMLLFTSERDGNKEIYVMNADGTGQARLTTDTAVDNQAVWSPDGTQILFMSERDGNSEIYIADLVFDGNVTYIPDSGFSGSDSFTYVANDGSADSNVATATITVNAVNSDPEITSDGAGATASVSIVENTTAVTTVTATDPDLDTPTFSITGGIDDGFFSIDPVSGVLTFDSAPNFESPADDNGDNVYIVEVTSSDGKGGSDVQTISVTVTDGNDAPAAVGDSYTAVEGIPYTASVGVDDLLLNDSDIDGDTLTVNTTPVSGPSNGELVLNADGSFIYTPNNNFNGTDSFVYEVSDGNGGTAQATATITVQPREIRILLSTQSDVNSSKVPGIQDWDAGEVLAIGDPNLSFEPAGSDGSLMPYFDLEGFSASGNMTINGMHFVSNDITVGGANSVDLQRGDMLFVAASNDVMTSTNSLAINAGDVIVFRPDTAGDFSSGTFIHLLDQPGTAQTTGITLIESDVVVGDVTLQAGNFLFTEEGFVEESSIYHFNTIDVGAGTTDGTISTLISSVDIGINFNNFQGIMIVSEDLYLDGTMVPAGSIVTTLANGDSFVGDNGILVDEDELFYLTVSTTTMGSGTTSADATVLFDAGDIGLNNNQKKIQSFTIIEEIRTVNNVDPEITLTAGSLAYTEGDPATVIDPGAVLTDPDSGDFDGGLLRVELGASGSANDELAIRNEGTGAGQIGITGSDVTYGGVVIGTWAGGSTVDEPLTVIFNANADVDAVQALLRNITYRNYSQNPLEQQRDVNFTVTDGDGGTSAVVTKAVVVNSVNAAPILSGANDLIAINEDLTNSAGTLVSVLTSSWITDADAASVEGIAVVGVDNTNGTWEFTIDGGTTWTAFGAPDASNARLLADNPDTAVRFVPDPDWNGTVTDGITFHAWDQTSGGNGDEVAITLAGSVSDQFASVSYSNSDGSAAWTSDWIEANDDGAAGSGNVRIDSGKLHLDSQGGGSGEAIVRSFDLSAAATATLSFDYDGKGSGSLDLAVIEISSDGGLTWTTLEDLEIVGNDADSKSYNLESYTALTADMQLRFRLATGFDTSGQYINFDNVDISYSGTGSGGSASVSTATASSSITVNPINDAPTGSVTISGTPTEDQTLSASNSLADAEGMGAVSYQWQRDGADISGATGSTYTLGDADVGSMITVVASYDDGEGTTESVTSAAVGPIANVDDPATIGGVDTGAVQEDVAVTSNNISTSGTLTIADPDIGESTFQAATINGTYGDLTIDTAGNWTYTAVNTQAAIQQLDALESITDTLTVTSFDGTTHNVVITINGAEDAPVIGGTTTGNVTEDGSLTSSGLLTISDIDTSDNPVSFNDVAPTAGTNGYGNFEITGSTWTYTLNNGHASVQALDAGESLTDAYTFTASDGSTQTVTVTINGAEDAPVIGGVATGTVAEDGTLTASDTLTITDADTSDNPVSFNDVAATLGDNGYGNFEITGNTWTYTLNNGHASVQALDVGETLTDTYTFTASDGSTQTVTVTINGAEDAPVIGGVATGTVAEDGTLTASDTLTITDADTSDNPVSFNDVAATLGDNGYGNFEITGNTWTYTLNNGHASVQALDAGESLNDTYTFTASDGSTQTVTVTINGSEDAPVIGGVATGTVAEDGTLTASDTLTITDADTSDNPVSFNDVAATLGDNGYGNFEITGNTWTYTLNNGHASVQALDAGETLNDTFTFSASDGSTQVVTVTINGAEDAAVIGGTATGTVAEDGTLTASDTLTITDADTSDNPVSFNDVAATLGDNGYGNFEITGNTWTYTLNNGHASVQALDAGESLTDTYTFTASDGSTQTVTVTINGAEDAPVIGGVATGTVAEDGTLTASDTLTITDVDTSDNPVSFNDVAATLGDNGYGNFEITSNAWTYTLNNGHASVQALDAGETLTDTYTFTASDGSTQTVTVTINGAEDAPVIGGVAAGTVAEDGTLTASDTLTISDADSSDNPVSFNDVAATLGDNGYGNFEITSNAWTYTLNNGHASVQALDAGETLTDTYTFTASDGSTQTVTVTINGAEDAPVIGGVATGTVAEDGTLTASDTLTISDADSSDNPISFNDVAATLGNNGYGNFEITSNTWTYTLNNAHANVQALDAGETLTDSYTFTASDGSTQIVTVTINGAEDAPVIGGVAAGTVAEDGTLTASDTLTISDADSSDNPISFNDVAATLGDNGYGNFEITGNTWTYTLNNGHASVQALDAGETLTDTYTFTASDGSTQTVTVTINGAEDAPVIGGVAAGTVAEDGTLTASDTLTITDADTSDNPISFNDVAATLGNNGYGNFEITGNTWTYTLNNGHASVQALDAGETLTDTYTFTASDGSTQTVTVTINGAEDAPVIGGVATGTVTEDGTLTASDTLTITDADTSDNPVSFNDVAATLGNNGYGNFEITGNTWTYTLNNGHASVQALDAGETLTDTYTFTASDGSTQTVTVTINGSEDAPVIGGVATGTVTEDGTLTASDTLTITDADTSDNPVSFNDVAATLGNNGYGNFEITGNTWTYTLNNGHASVQALDAGETLTDTYTFTASDGSTQTVTVTINGAEDMPTLDNAIADQSATEDLAFNFVFAANSFGDLDASDTLTYTATLSDDSPLPAWLSFDSATRTFSGTPANGDVGAIDIKVTADDGSSTVSDVFTLTVINSSDAPVIGGVDSGAVTEDVAVVGGSITASDSLTIADPDAGESSFIAATINGSYGDLTIDSAGNWNYSADNSQVSIQALDAGESLTDTLTVTTFDGSTHDIVITIDGAEDAAVIGGTAVGGVAEDGSLTVTDTLTITDADTSDNPVSFTDVTATLGDNGYGNFEITGNAWTYTLNNGHASVQALDVGETLTDTYTFTASDGSTQTVTVTIDGAEDAPVLGGGASGNVTEDGVLIDGNTLTITDADSSDNPVSFNDVAATLGDNGYGNFEITSNTWTYTLNNGHASVQALDAGETLTDTYTFAASDGSTRTVTVTINGSEDAAVIGGTATGTVAEDGTPSASDTLTITDADTSDNPVSFNDVAATLGDNGYGNFEITGNTWTYTLNNGHASVQALDAGESLNDTYTFTASDGSTLTVTVTINGAEDAPVIGGVATGTVAEDGTLTASDTLTITDADSSDNPVSFNDVAATLGDNGYGNFEITGNSWSYTLNNGHASVQALDAGESLNDTYTFTASDGSTQTVTVTINGAEDAPVIGGVVTGTVAEDGTPTASDTLTITDADASDNPVSFNDVAATLGDNGYGNFEITSNTWTYTLNNGHASVQALNAGESLTDTYTFTASDGSTRIVTVTINGAEDTPVIGGVATGTVAEDGTLTASDTLTITDADSSDNPISFNDVAATLGDNGYGNFEITSNTWTYTLNNAHASVQALDAGETLTDSYTFTASDGSTRTVTVTINGAEDSPVIGGVASGTVNEDGTLVDGNTLSITDVDSSDNPVSFNDVAATLGDNGYGNFEITGNAWTYTLNNGHASVQALDAGEILTDTYTFTASDGSTQTVTVTINGAEDAPVIGGVAAGTVAEDGTLTASDTLTITDADTSDNPVSFNDVAATLGDNGYGNFEITGNTWTYTLNNGHAAVQALDVGETLTDSYTFTASDGSTQTVTVTINGAEDMPTLDNAIADQSATEDLAFNFVFAANSFGDLDASDTLTYTATLSDDSPLPAWLSFDSATRTFSGTPANADTGAIDIKVTADDGSSTISDIFTLTVNNASDAPVIGGVDTGAVTEDVGVLGGVISTTGSLTIADPDAGESSFQPATVNGSYGDLTIDSAGNWMYSANNGQAALQSLDAGESLTDTLTVTTFDGTTHDITITLNGSEDAAVLGGITAGNVAEDGSLSDGNTLTITDADASDNPVSFNDVAATLGDNGYGNFEITGNAWTYTLNNGHAAVQGLDVGETLTDSFTFSASDGSTQTVTVTINGAEDLPVIGGVVSGSVAEDGTLTVSDTLTITDADGSDNPVSFNDVASTPGDNGYGSFEIIGNTWTYTLNNGHPAVQGLDVGESLNDSYTFTASDGSTQTVTVTINGAEDAPVLGGVATGTVTEDGVLTAGDTLTITDADASDNPVSFNDVAPTLGDNGYGNFEMTGNTWTYALNNGHASVQALDSGEMLTDSYTFIASDGSTQTVTVIINGVEDAPTLDNAIADQSATEGMPFNFSFAANTFGDLDASDALTYSATLADSSPLPAWLNFDAATRTFSGTPGAGDIGTIDIRISADDGSSAISDTFSLTVIDFNNLPVIGGVDQAALTEDRNVSDGQIAAAGALTVADADIGESSFVAGTVNGALGSLSIDAAGNWRYSADNTQAEIQALQTGESITEALTVTTADGSTHEILVVINGASEAAPPPVVEPPVVEPPPEPEPPPVEEEPEPAPEGGAEDQILEEVTPLPQESSAPPVQQESDVSTYLQEQAPDVEQARVYPDVARAEPMPVERPQLQQIHNQNLSLDRLTLQVSDDEALNDSFELELLDRIDSMHKSMDSEAAYQNADDVEVQIVMGSTATITAGIVSWVLRGGSLLASLMGTVPLLNRFDPLPILKTREDEEDVEPDEDGDDTQSQEKQHARRVDNMFSGKQERQPGNGSVNE